MYPQVCDHKVEEGVTNKDLNQQGTVRKIQMELNKGKMLEKFINFMKQTADSALWDKTKASHFLVDN